MEIFGLIIVFPTTHSCSSFQVVCSFLKEGLNEKLTREKQTKRFSNILCIQCKLLQQSNTNNVMLFMKMVMMNYHHSSLVMMIVVVEVMMMAMVVVIMMHPT